MQAQEIIYRLLFFLISILFILLNCQDPPLKIYRERGPQP